MADAYDLRPVATTSAELHAAATLLRAVFPHATYLDVRYLRWLYAENPAGTVVGVNAWHGGELVAHYVTIPLRARCGMDTVPAALSLNTAVHAAHRGRGLFTRLAAATYDLARAAGIRHVVGVANAQSTPGFVRTLGFHDLGRLAARLLWAAPSLVRDPAAPSWARVWNPPDLAWRLASPARRYGLERRGDLRALLAPTGWPGLWALLRVERAAEAFDLGSLPLTPVAPIGPRLWLGRSLRLGFGAFGGIVLPDRLRPSPLNLIFRDLDAPAERPDPQHVEFAALDFDAY